MQEGTGSSDACHASMVPAAVKPRQAGIDLFRGSLVILVILGHFAEITERHHFLTWFGYGFRMPLFIGLTGYLFNLEQARRMSPGDLLAKYYDRLILPWLAACAITLAVTGSLSWWSPISALVQPPYHLWFVPVILAFFFAAQVSRISPSAMLAIAIPTSIVAMFVFGVGHDVWRGGAWMPDRRFFIYPIYFALGMWVARRPNASSHEALLLLVAFIGLLWWSRLYVRPSTSAEIAAVLLLCVPLIVMFPWLKRVSFDIRWLSAIGRDSLFFYLSHPLAFAIWSATGITGTLHLALSVTTIIAAWLGIRQTDSLANVLGVRSARLSPQPAPPRSAEAVSAGSAV